MKTSWLCVFVAIVALAGCAGAPIKNTSAAQILSHQLNIPEQQLMITGVSGTSSTLAIDAAIKVSFLLQKDSSGQWKIIKINRTGKWEDPSIHPLLGNAALTSSLLAKINQ